MKSVPLLLAAAAAVAGCSTLAERSHGSWLDRVGQHKPAAHPFTPEEAKALGEQQAGLEARASALRVQLAAERDRVQRFAYMRQLKDIGDELRPLEESLRAGGTDSRRWPAPPDYRQGGGE